MVLLVMVEVVSVIGTPTSHSKIYIGRTKKDWGFQTSHHEHTTSPMGLFISIYYPVVDYDVSSFGVATGDSQSGVVPSTTNLTFQKSEGWIDGGDFVLSRSKYYSFMSHS